MENHIFDKHFSSCNLTKDRSLSEYFDPWAASHGNDVNGLKKERSCFLSFCSHSRMVIIVLNAAYPSATWLFCSAEWCSSRSLPRVKWPREFNSSSASKSSVNNCHSDSSTNSHCAHSFLTNTAGACSQTSTEQFSTFERRNRF